MRKLMLILALAMLAVPNAADAKTETVQADCAAMADWYECRDVKSASLLVQDGYEMIHNTPVTLGPWGDHKGPDGGPIIKTTLSCDSCHFAGGQAEGGIPFFQVRDKYAPPGQYWRAGNHKRLIAERINWCMVSCANGQMIDENSYEMQAMIAYINWVAEGIKDLEMLALPDGWKKIPGHDLPLMNPNGLSMTANADNGRRVYQNRCDECHGDRGPGQGRYDEGEPRARVPALWGSNSFTKGAQGMYTAPLLATLIKRFMPLGEANLTEQQALDVAGYIDSMPHDMGFMTETFFGGNDPETGIPNYLFKPSYFPVGVAIPNDPFTFQQRLLGPWKPIEDWQAQQRAAFQAAPVK